MEKNEQIFHRLAEIDSLKGTEIYNLFEKDIEIIKILFSFNENKIDQNFLKSFEFENFKNKFAHYIKQKSWEDFRWIVLILYIFSRRRIKLIPLLPSLLLIVFDIYYKQEKEIKTYINTMYYIPQIKELFSEDAHLNKEEIKGKFIQIDKNDHNQTIDDNINKNTIFISILLYDDIDRLISTHPSPTKTIYTDDELLDNIIPYDITLLNLSCYFASRKCFKYLFLNEPYIDKKTAKYSIIGGNTEIIQILSFNNADFNNLFHVSIKFHRYSLSDWLFANFICENVSLSYCIHFLNFECFLFLYHNNYILNDDFDLKNDVELLHYSCWLGFIDLVEYFLSQGIDKDSTDEFMETPLFYACKTNQFQIIKYLISIGCNKDIVNKGNENPLHTACSNNDLEIVKLLVSNGFSKDIKNEYRSGNTPLFNACNECNLPIIQYLISEGCDKNLKNNMEETILHIACEKNNFEIIKYLVSQGCDKEAKDKYGRTPLLIATRVCSLQVIQNLISQGCDKEARDNDNRTILFCACVRGDLQIIQYLISIGCDIDTKDKWGRSPLHISCENGELPIVQILVNHGCDKESKDNKGRTPLFYACNYGHLDVIEYLISAGSDKEAKDINHYTPLAFSCKKGMLNSVRLLIENGCDMESNSLYDGTPLLVSVDKRHINIVKYLIEHGCNKEAKSPIIAETILHHACHFYRTIFVKYLIEQGCNKESTNYEGKTPLHIACEYNKIETVRYLLSIGCDKNAKNFYDKTPMDIAKEKNYLSIINELNKY